MEHQESKYRNSRMEFDNVYFWTDTIKDWKRLLKPDKYKGIIISSWQELTDRKMILVYGFVIMPNHLHVVWEMKEPNGKEMPHASFNKYTSHIILVHQPYNTERLEGQPPRRTSLFQSGRPGALTSHLATRSTSGSDGHAEKGGAEDHLYAQQPAARTLELSRPP